MFDLSWGELLIIGMVALIAIGPKELPGVLRGIGHWMGKVRRMASDFQDQFREAMREAEVADLKKQFDDASATATSAFTNPLETAHKQVEAALGSEPTASDKAAQSDATQSDATQSAVTTSDPGAIEPSASAEVAEPERPSILEPAVAAADAPHAEPPLDIKPDSAKPGGSGAA